MQLSSNPRMKMVLITDGANTKNEADTINRLFREGLDELHIRKPEFDKQDYIKLIDNIDEEYHPRLVLHDCYSLVHTYDIRKIHVNRDWRDSKIMEMILDRVILKGKKIAKTICVSKCKDLKASIHIDEIVLGPVFTKAMYTVNKQLIDTEEIARAIRFCKVPVLGLGGASVENMDVFKNAGFAGVVMQKGVWTSADPVQAFIQMRDKANEVIQHQLRIAI